MTPLVVRTSQSGIIPDTPGPLPEISGLIPDNADIDPSFKVRGVLSFMSNCPIRKLIFFNVSSDSLKPPSPSSLLPPI